MNLYLHWKPLSSFSVSGNDPSNCMYATHAIDTRKTKCISISQVLMNTNFRILKFVFVWPSKTRVYQVQCFHFINFFLLSIFREVEQYFDKTQNVKLSRTAIHTILAACYDHHKMTKFGRIFYTVHISVHSNAAGCLRFCAYELHCDVSIINNTFK